MGLWDDIVERTEELVSGVGSAAQDYAEGYWAFNTGNWGRAFEEADSFFTNIGIATNLIDKNKKSPRVVPPDPNAPDRAGVLPEAIQNQKEFLQKKKASQTLFAGQNLGELNRASSQLVGF